MGRYLKAVVQASMFRTANSAKEQGYGQFSKDGKDRKEKICT